MFHASKGFSLFIFWPSIEPSLRIFPFLPVTSKPAEVRMGKGKGSLKYWCFPVKPGRLLFEFQGVSVTLALEINKLVNSKLALTTKLIKFLWFQH